MKPFDAAVRDNRQGILRVGDEIIFDVADAGDLVREIMLVIKEECDPIGRYRLYHGYSYEFYPQPLGAKTPAYSAIFERRPGSPAKFLRMEKI